MRWPVATEPVLTDKRLAPEVGRAGRIVDLAFMVLLDTLSPEERAVFVLRGARVLYAEIASVLNGTEANCRQLFHRAKERLRSGQSRSARSREQKRALAERFVSAMRAGDGDELTRVLAADVGFWGDGGGRVVAARRPLLGETRSCDCCSAFGAGLWRMAMRGTGSTSSSSRSTTTRDAGARGRPHRLRLRLFDRGRRDHRHSCRPQPRQAGVPRSPAGHGGSQSGPLFERIEAEPGIGLKPGEGEALWISHRLSDKATACSSSVSHSSGFSAGPGNSGNKFTSCSATERRQCDAQPR